MLTAAESVRCGDFVVVSFIGFVVMELCVLGTRWTGECGVRSISLSPGLCGVVVDVSVVISVVSVDYWDVDASAADACGNGGGSLYRIEAPGCVSHGEVHPEYYWYVPSWW